jgi:hypothetical protein
MLIDAFLLETARVSNNRVEHPYSIKFIPEVVLPSTRHGQRNSDLADICLNGKVDYIMATIPFRSNQLNDPVSPEDKSKWKSSARGRLNLFEAKHDVIQSGYPEVIMEGVNALETFECVLFIIVRALGF